MVLLKLSSLWQLQRKANLYQHKECYRRLQIEPLEYRKMLAVIDLSILGTGGTIAYGADSGDLSGTSVSGVGDINGDGFDDLAIGASGADAFGNAKTASGESYVIFGAGLLPTSIDLASLGSAGITIFGANAYDLSGISVSGAGDVNGDGFDDLLIGASYADGLGNSRYNAGDSYIVFGTESFPPTIDLANLGSAGITIFGANSNDLSGISVSSAGDVNGDGLDDLLVGASNADAFGNAKNNSGDSYLLFGNFSFPETIDLNNIGTAGVTIYGADAGDQSGISVSAAGDFNGDGFDDLVIGALFADASGNTKPNSGDSYVLFGRELFPAVIDLASLGAPDISLFGVDVGDFSGRTVSQVGDFNGDGLDDLLIGAEHADALGNAKSDAGESYLIFGAAVHSASIDLANLGSQGITLYGADAVDQSGWSVSGAGDVNGDGFDDLLIGAVNADASDNGKLSAGDTYVIFGVANPPSAIDLSDIDSIGITLFGADINDQSGRSVSNAGDVNGDGFDDFVIGARNARAFQNAKPNAGESYWIFGQDFTESVTHHGTMLAETLTGTAALDVMIGSGGNDILIGNGGTDVLRGGEGDDLLAVSDLDFERIVGGNGLDTLRLEAHGHIFDLSNISDNRIVDIETIDITGSGNNSLILNHREVLNISSHSNTLVVRRNAGDVVNIGPGWTQQANEVIGPDTFEVFTQGAARVKIQLAGASSTILGSFVNHVGYSGGGSSIDSGKVLAKEGAIPTLLTYDKLINTSRGINGIVFDIDELPGTPNVADFVFQMSPQGAFDLGANPVGSWASASAPSSVTVFPGSPTRVSIIWPDNAIANRWLRITVLANANTGLADPEIYYIGHLLGETTGPSGSVFTVSFADITPIRTAVGSTVNASSPVDVDKNGTVAFADISEMRPNVGAQLTIITTPAAGGGGGGGGSMATTLSGIGNSHVVTGQGPKGLIAAPFIDSQAKEIPRGEPRLNTSELATSGRDRGVRQSRPSNYQLQAQTVNLLQSSRARDRVFAAIGNSVEHKLRIDIESESMLQAISQDWESMVERFAK